MLMRKCYAARSCFIFHLLLLHYLPKHGNTQMLYAALPKVNHSLLDFLLQYCTLSAHTYADVLLLKSSNLQGEKMVQAVTWLSGPPKDSALGC